MEEDEDHHQTSQLARELRHDEAFDQFMDREGHTSGDKRFGDEDNEELENYHKGNEDSSDNNSDSEYLGWGNADAP